MAVHCEVHPEGQRLTVAVNGLLRLSDSVPLRERLLKCLAEQPEALLIDLGGLHVDQPLALSVFTAILQQAARWPGTPVLLHSPPPRTRDLLINGAYRQLPLVADRAAAEARLSDERLVIPQIRDDLLPVSGSTRHARDVVTDACLRWDLPDLVAPASLIVTELVANVIDHAHTMMALRVSLRKRYLNIAVRDGSADPPEPGGPHQPHSTHGRGLLLIDSMAYTWGWLPTESGKVVWAALRREP
ncbi:ATP-binding protein [Actinoplanes sp. NPDC023936]|uniref:ATP-binding protein n=1 Tax=Actinoplanes sp. NPDC023936 TaxID=3154910 RepID=UPI003406DF8A